ncbi:glycosyltransferase [Pseudomonas mangiferae]|uniref:glycosyltransferase n=1 Tax=Pseudomonas mangiferae TaxID=2593654 RepID=UPI0015B6C95D|nr:glycosyltransferase [Pseudomonas mangiferae]
MPVSSNSSFSNLPVVVVVVPVYSGLEQTLACLDSVFADEPKRVRRRVLVVNDASPDPDLARAIREQATAGRFALVEHQTNLGFPSAVNRALDYVEHEPGWSGADVVLLNADTRVAAGWLDKLHGASQSRPRVGTVTPFSNNASICSVPFAEGCEVDSSLDVGHLDAAAERANPGHVVELPTGVGFCLYIRRECLAAVGRFDVAAFGRGYGEETDFCRRAYQAGFLHLLACDTYVYHEGQVSFGATEGDTRRLRAEALIHRRYPDYPGGLLRWLRQDPAGPARVALALEAMRGSSRPVILMVTHRMGGGVERHVQELRYYLRGFAWVLVLRPGEKGGSVELSIGSAQPERLCFDLPVDGEPLLAVVHAAGTDRIHVHHGAGFPETTWPLLNQLGLPHDLTLHDYAIVGGNPTLTTRAGRFDATRDARQADDQSDPVLAFSLQALARSAERCIVPCPEAGRVLNQALPWLTAEAHAHPDREAFGPYLVPHPPLLKEGEPMRVLCLGALGREKGAETLRDAARLARRRGRPLEFVLLGSAHIPLGREVKQLGRYQDKDLAGLLANARPHLAWFPVHWPETWSYTLSAALEAGLPVAATDLGAFHDRLGARPWTWLEAHPVSVERWLEVLMAARERLAMASRDGAVWSQKPAAAFYREAYLSKACRGERVQSVLGQERLCRFHCSYYSRGPEGRRPWLLAIAMRIREWPVLGAILARIPYPVQRRLKRLLSRQPLH